MANNYEKARKRRRRWLVFGGLAVVLVVVVVALTGALRSNHPIDPSKLATVERGDIGRSVVATGKIEPLVKVEVKSKPAAS